METQGQRLARLRKEAGLSQATLAKLAGLSGQGSIGNIERDTRGYGASIVEIAKILNTTPEYLLLQADIQNKKANSEADGIAPEDVAPHSRLSEMPNTSSTRSAHGPYPLISEVQAGNWTEICHTFAHSDAEEWSISAHNLGPHGYLLRVEGKSMYAPGEEYSFAPGMILHVRPDVDPLPGQFVVVRREEHNSATFKRYMLIEGQPYLVAINPDWPKELKYIPIKPGDTWCGVVVDASLGKLP